MQQLRKIHQKCTQGKMSVPEAVRSIDQLVGGISRVSFQEGKKLTIANENTAYSLPVHGLRKKEQDRLYGLAAVAYQQAQQNGSKFPGEVHISKYASTKHHSEGIYDLQRRYAA